RYGGGSPDFAIEREVLAGYPDLDVELLGAEPDSAADMIALGQTADAMLLSTRDAVTRKVVSRIPRVKVIGRYGVGLDNVDLDAATEHGIVITHFPQYCTAEVADHALAFILAANRRIVELDHDLREGAWTRHKADTDAILRGAVPPMRELTIGIIGFGAIGRAVAARLKAFGSRLIAFDPFVSGASFAEAGVESCGFEGLLAEADIVTIHCPLTSETRGLIDAAAFALMKPAGVLVNTARGPIVNQAALTAHLQANPQFRALVDVVEVEPLPLDSPLFALPNVTLTPHSAYYSLRSVEIVQRETLIGALDALSGVRPVTVANPAVLRSFALDANPRTIDG
ncbi:MAG TPA: C-terminal binding protein, partial [Thermomicrobiales bacterium]|nr:C-terminal binding protein [Thermomicrobiales bacterium]